MIREYKDMKQNTNVLSIIRTALWDEPFVGTINEDDYVEMQKQAVLTLIGPCLAKYHMSQHLFEKWRLSCIQQVYSYARYRRFQDQLPISVPYVILKGTSAGQYYPYPEYRTMGDIDIMTKREDFDIAYHELLANGFRIIKTLNRETSFVKNGYVLELHTFFASLNDTKKAKYLDDMIIENINVSHRLPELVNGLTILEHISQHLEHGLGLRQVIDWMMFAYRYLSDDRWNSFKKLADDIGLAKLALVLTKMCVEYLGLPSLKWCECSKIKNGLCEQLMDYILSNGNFGGKRNSDSAISENVLVSTRNPISTIKLLQQRGMKNWKAAKSHRILQRFAWLYQAGRYISKGFQRENAIIKVHNEYKAAQKKKKMFDELGVIQASKGFIIYKDGEYRKK